MAARCLQGLQTSALSELHSIMRTSRLMRMKCPGHLRKLIRMENDSMAYDNDGYDFRAGLPRQLPLQQGLVAPRPVQAVRRQVRGRMVLPSQSTSPQMRKGEGRGRGGRIELTPEHVSFPLCIIVQIHVVLFYIFSKIYYSAPIHRSIRFQALLHH